MTLKVYADLFDTDLDALAEVLTKARRAALKQPSTASADSKSAGENVPGTLEQTLQVFYQSFSWSGWRCLVSGHTNSVSQDIGIG